jgi:hypothetical protein
LVRTIDLVNVVSKAAPEDATDLALLGARPEFGTATSVPYLASDTVTTHLEEDRRTKQTIINSDDVPKYDTGTTYTPVAKVLRG